MDNSKITVEISKLVDRYFVEKTKTPMRDSDSINIRSAMNHRIDGYFPKSLLNDILIKKGYLFKVESENNYYYNISHRDIKILASSQAILTRLSRKTNWKFSDYVRLHKFRNVDLYKYRFKYIIKYKFHSDFIERNHTELDIYNVIAKELGIDISLTKQYIETFNTNDFPDMPDDILIELLKLFDIEKNECLTDNE